MPAALAFGGAFHSAVERIHQSRLEGVAVPDVEHLLRVYDESWQIETAEGPVQYAKSEDERSLRVVAERMLTAYRDHAVSESQRAGPVQILAIEHPERFDLLAEVPPIEMRLDLLELTRNGDLIVTDVKTSRSRWNETKLQEALPQLVLYANGLMPLLRAVGAKRIVPTFVIVTKAKAPVIQRLQPQATHADVDRLKRQVMEVWEGIRREIFPQRTSWMCSQCPFKKHCLG